MVLRRYSSDGHTIRYFGSANHFVNKLNSSAEQRLSLAKLRYSLHTRTISRYPKRMRHFSARPAQEVFSLGILRHFRP